MKNLTREQITEVEHAIREMTTDDQLALAVFSLRRVVERMKDKTCPGCVRIRAAAEALDSQVGVGVAECRELAAKER